jgi:hypothetical protein
MKKEANTTYDLHVVTFELPKPLLILRMRCVENSMVRVATFFTGYEFFVRAATRCDMELSAPTK